MKSKHIFFNLEPNCPKNNQRKKLKKSLIINSILIINVPKFYKYVNLKMGHNIGVDSGFQNKPAHTHINQNTLFKKYFLHTNEK